LQEAIKNAGYDIKDVKAVIMGHLHLDHAGGLDYFRNTGTPIYVHEEEFKHACWAVATNSEGGLYLWVFKLEPDIKSPSILTLPQNLQRPLFETRRHVKLADIQWYAVGSVYRDNIVPLSRTHPRTVHHAGQPSA